LECEALVEKAGILEAGFDVGGVREAEDLGVGVSMFRDGRRRMENSLFVR
jgi:hypothetical protein